MFNLAASKTTTNTTNQSWADAFNTSMSKSEVTDNTGNTTINLGAASGGSGSTVKDLLPIAAIGCMVLGVILFFRSR
jgi:hypothetical protein